MYLQAGRFDVGLAKGIHGLGGGLGVVTAR